MRNHQNKTSIDQVERRQSIIQSILDFLIPGVYSRICPADMLQIFTNVIGCLLGNLGNGDGSTCKMDSMSYMQKIVKIPRLSSPYQNQCRDDIGTYSNVLQQGKLCVFSTYCFETSILERWHAQPPGAQKSKCLMGVFLGTNVLIVSIRMHDNLGDAGIQVTTPGREIRQTEK